MIDPRVLRMSIVQVDGLTKQYGNFRALDGCCLSVPEGSVFGLLGPNGAGKTTLIRSLLGYLRPSSGSATVDGFDCARESLAVRERVSYLPAETKLFRTMRGKACIEFFTSIHPRGDFTRAKRIAERLQLDTSRRVAFMSTGMRQKLAISCVLSCNSRVIILDEPTANLDPNVRQEVLSLVMEAQSRGATVIFCSHVLSEIEEICDYAAFLRRGKVVESLNLSSLPTIHRISFQSDEGIPDVTAGDCVLSKTADGRMVTEVTGDMHSQLQWLSNSQVKNLTIESIGLRSVYERIHSA
jgi:ABC-2 type transport system ATP-binding protein